MRFARVPTGSSTCGWCYMLASRGFDYSSATAAAAGSHAGCDCVVMAGRPDVELWYDVEWLKRCWQDCSRTVGGNVDRRELRRAWDAMPPEERAEWQRKHGKDAFDAYCDRMAPRPVIEEVRRRDAEWLYRGRTPPISWQAARDAVPQDMATCAERLAGHGIAVTVRETGGMAWLEMGGEPCVSPRRMADVAAAWSALGHDGPARVALAVATDAETSAHVPDGVGELLLVGPSVLRRLFAAR